MRRVYETFQCCKLDNMNLWSICSCHSVNGKFKFSEKKMVLRVLRLNSTMFFAFLTPRWCFYPTNLACEQALVGAQAPAASPYASENSSGEAARHERIARVRDSQVNLLVLRPLLTLSYIPTRTRAVCKSPSLSTTLFLQIQSVIQGF